MPRPCHCHRLSHANPVAQHNFQSTHSKHAMLVLPSHITSWLRCSTVAPHRPSHVSSITAPPQEDHYEDPLPSKYFWSSAYCHDISIKNLSGGGLLNHPSATYCCYWHTPRSAWIYHVVSYHLDFHHGANISSKVLQGYALLFLRKSLSTSI